ncbi:MAG TPA: succinate--CoA ligase subunit beta, partial [Ruminiclostridium sp.]|nr:succinate--CoA ligase subunit beta [Ruminiclostridium sp.]
MKLLEYKAKELFEQFGVPVMHGCVVDDLGTIAQTIENAGLTYPVVVKAQVQIGGRGKAGGIRFADNAGEAGEHCRALLHSELKGYRVDKLLIVEKAEHEIEWYLSIMLDRLSKRPMIIFSAEGGVDIEETSRISPSRVHKLVIDPMIGIQAYMARYFLSASGLSLDYLGRMHELLCNLYRCFNAYDCMLCEINPLILDKKGQFIALDSKVDIDDSALYRLPDMAAFRDSIQEEALIREARDFGFLYIPIEKDGSIAVMSNGSGMLMSCIDLISREGMKVCAALDLGGGATSERIAQAVRILVSTPGIKALLINIFGGITRCDEVAGGIKLALMSAKKNMTAVIRLEGTNKEKGLEIIAS